MNEIYFPFLEGKGYPKIRKTYLRIRLRRTVAVYHMEQNDFLKCHLSDNQYFQRF